MRSDHEDSLESGRHGVGVYENEKEGFQQTVFTVGSVHALNRVSIRK